MMDCVALEEEQLLDGMQPEAEEEPEAETEYDEHVWTSVPNAMQIASAVCDALCKADKAHETSYRANNDAYQQKLQALDDAFRALAATKKGRHFLVGDRFPFLYFATEYGLTFYAAFPGCAAETEANPAALGGLIDRAKREDIRTVFKVDLSPGNVAQTIAESTGAKIETLWSCHVVSAADFAAGATYVSLMERNLRALENA